MANPYIEAAKITYCGQMMQVVLRDDSYNFSPIVSSPVSDIQMTVNGSPVALGSGVIIWDSTLGYAAIPLPSKLTNSDVVVLNTTSGWATTQDGPLPAENISVENLTGKNLDDVDLYSVTMPVGWNISTITYFDTVPLYNNLGKQLLDGPHIYRSNGNNQFTSNTTVGYISLPSGNYNVSYQDFSTPPNTYNHTYNWYPQPGTYYININLYDNFPIQNISIYQEGADTNQRFNPAYLNKIKRGKVLRFMQTWSTNVNTVKSVSDISSLSRETYSPASNTITASTITNIDKFDDTTGYYWNNPHWYKILVTTAAPHNLSTGEKIKFSGMGANVVFDDGSTANINNGAAHVFVQSDTVFATMIYNQTSGLTANVTNQSISGTATNGSSYTIPIEDMVALCNTNNSDMWINIPMLFGDSDVATISEYIANNLHSSLKCYMEYSNEHWNYNLGGANFYFRGMGAQIGLNYTQYYTKRAGEIHTVAETYLGDRLVRVFGSWYTSSSVTSDIVNYASANGIKVDAVAVAPYTNNVPSQSYFASIYDNMSIDQMIDLYEMNIWSASQLNQIPVHYSVLKAAIPDAELVCYEGGPQDGSLTTNSVNLVERSFSWSRHPRMRQCYHSFLKYLQNNGISLYVDYLGIYYDVGVSMWAKYCGYNQLPGYGDGSDGYFDNRTNYLDLYNVVSVIGGAFDSWGQFYERNVGPTQYITDYLASQLRDFNYRSSSTFNKPSDIHIALTHNYPNHTYAGNTTDEITGSGYLRFSLPASDANWSYSTRASGQTYNNEKIVFGPATEDWGWVSGVMVVDSATNGNALICSSFTKPKHVLSGGYYTIPISGLGIQFS